MGFRERCQAVRFGLHGQELGGVVVAEAVRAVPRSARSVADDRVAACQLPTYRPQPGKLLGRRWEGRGVLAGVMTLQRRWWGSHGYPMFRRLRVLGGLLAGYTATLTTDPITLAIIGQVSRASEEEPCRRRLTALRRRALMICVSRDVVEENADGMEAPYQGVGLVTSQFTGRI
ncbi:hypothetical protein ACWENQ_44130 [Nonomuraea sp. NPDC004354]